MNLETLIPQWSGQLPPGSYGTFILVFIGK